MMKMTDGIGNERSTANLQWSEAQNSILNHASSTADSLGDSPKGGSIVVFR